MLIGVAPRHAATRNPEQTSVYYVTVRVFCPKLTVRGIVNRVHDRDLCLRGEEIWTRAQVQM